MPPVPLGGIKNAKLKIKKEGAIAVLFLVAKSKPGNTHWEQEDWFNFAPLILHF